MIDMWEREFKRRGLAWPNPVRSVNKATRTERQKLRERAYSLLTTMDRERVIDRLLMENEKLSCHAAELVVMAVEKYVR